MERGHSSVIKILEKSHEIYWSKFMYHMFNAYKLHLSTSNIVSNPLFLGSSRLSTWVMVEVPGWCLQSLVVAGLNVLDCCLQIPW